MIPRPLLFLAGAGAGAYAVVKARQVAESFTVDGLRDRASALGLGARLLVQEVASGQAEKEAELRERFGLDIPARAALAAATPGLPGRTAPAALPAQRTSSTSTTTQLHPRPMTSGQTHPRQEENEH